MGDLKTDIMNKDSKHLKNIPQPVNYAMRQKEGLKFIILTIPGTRAN